MGTENFIKIFKEAGVKMWKTGIIIHVPEQESWFLALLPITF